MRNFYTLCVLGLLIFSTNVRAGDGFDFFQGDSFLDDVSDGLNPYSAINQEIERQQEEILKDKYKWLYEILIPEHERLAEPDRAERSFIVHLKDTQSQFPHPDRIAAANLSAKLPYASTGKITYVGVYKAKYLYDLSRDENQDLNIEVRVHFQAETPKQVSSMKNIFLQAENIWNSSKIKTDFNYHFHFTVVEEAKAAHFSVKLIAGDTRGPYFKTWSARWTPNTVAHELGHMMGLADEYKTLSGKINCLKSYLMCASWTGQIAYQHHYHILRRALSSAL